MPPLNLDGVVGLLGVDIRKAQRRAFLVRCAAKADMASAASERTSIATGSDNNHYGKIFRKSGGALAAVDVGLDGFDATAKRVDLGFKIFGRRHEAGHVSFDFPGSPASTAS